MGGHREGHVGENPKRQEILLLHLVPRRVDHRKSGVAVREGAAVAGHDAS